MYVQVIFIQVQHPIQEIFPMNKHLILVKRNSHLVSINQNMLNHRTLINLKDQINYHLMLTVALILLVITNLNMEIILKIGLQM